MKIVLLTLFLAVALKAQSPVTLYIDPSDGAAPLSSLSQLPSTYQFPSTSVGQASSIIVRVVNTSSAAITVDALYVGSAAGAAAANPNFNIVGFDTYVTLSPYGTSGDWAPAYIEFTPTVSGTSTGYLQVSVAGQSAAAISTLSGNGLSSSVSLTCIDTLLTLCDGKTPIAPNSSLTFGATSGVAVGSTYSIPFTLTNNTSNPIPVPTIANTTYSLPSFTSPNLASLPATIAPGSTVNFTVVFSPQATAPGAATSQTAVLTIGSGTYTLQGYELVANNNDPVQVSCVYSTGQPCQGPANTVNTYSVGPNLNTLSLIFTVTNPNPVGTAFADITLPAPPSISDTTDFTLGTATLIPTGSSSSGTAITAGQPVTIQPGYSLTFQVTFTGASNASGTLTIGNGIAYTLNGQPAPAVGSTGSDLPGITLMCGATPCSSQTFGSQQQVQATLQVNTATTAGATLAISFTSLVSGVTDPAITFISPYNTPNLSFSFTPSSLSGMLGNGQPGFTFQTGTTAGTINFTLTDSATLQTMTLPAITIQPAKVQIETATAVRSDPNLIVTITGYDNTYSAGQLSFTFYDLSGNNLTPNAIQVNAATAFKDYFFSSSNTAGGAFSLQVTFPVTGDVTQVGSVTANITNSAGQSSVTSTFQ